MGNNGCSSVFLGRSQLLGLVANETGQKRLAGGILVKMRPRSLPPGGAGSPLPPIDKAPPANQLRWVTGRPRGGFRTDAWRADDST